MKKLKRFLSGCAVLTTALFLCIPAMAGGYSAKSELKVNIIGIRPWPEEPEVVNEILLLTEQELPQATPSDASKSNAARTSILHLEDELPDKHPTNTSSSNVELWDDGKDEEKDFGRSEEMDGIPHREPDEGQEEEVSTPSNGRRSGISDADTMKK